MPWSHFVIEGVRILVAEDGVERDGIDLIVGPLGVDEPNERPGMSQFSNHDRTGAGLQHDDATPGQSLGYSLIDAQGDDVA